MEFKTERTLTVREPTKSYVVTISEIERGEKIATENHLVKESPTEHRESNSYSQGDKVVMEKEYKTVDVVEPYVNKRRVFKQIVPMEEFDMEAVICAVNSIVQA